MKRTLLTLFVLACLAYVLFAQTPAPYQFSVSPGTTVSNCTVVASQTTYCYTGAGLYVSLNGAAFAGPVPITLPAIPTKAVIPAQTLPAQTVPLQ
jgi:hypothetical protein